MNPHLAAFPTELVLATTSRDAEHKKAGQTLSAKSASSGLFQNGDRWTIVGDSISQWGLYATQVYLYYATRFPDLKLVLRNAGNSGDSADGGIIRYGWDIQPQNSTVVSIMFGMNDVRRELYDDPSPTPESLSKRAHVLEKYRWEMTALAARCKADGVRVIFVTPSIYDETLDSERPPQIGVNGALGKCAAFLRQLASEIEASVIDLHDPMTALNAKLQTENPPRSLIRPDRVHPDELGHFAMAYFFLKGQNAPAIVSSISIDLEKSHVIQAVNATVENLNVRNGGATFTVAEKALPFPIGKEFEQALAWLPFEDELNQEILQVNGLIEADYLLSIDDRKVRRYSSLELTAGVNVALEKNTPQALQAAGVLELVRQWQKVTAEIRVIANFEFWRLGDVPHPIALETVLPRVENEIARLSGATTPEGKNERDFFQRYLEAKPKQAGNQIRLEELEQQIRLAAKPQPHVWKLQPVK